MGSEPRNENSLSAAFFCPQSKAPDEEYLNGLYSFLRQNQYGQALLQEISELEKTWTIFANASNAISALSQGPILVDILQNWATSGESGPLAEARSGIVALPLLVVLQIGQYLRYLEYHNLAHHEFVAQIRHAGGAQGYCGGLPSAIALACGKNEMEVVKYTAIVARVLLGIGAFGEAADDSNGKGSTTLALRLKHEGQGDELTQRFSGTHVSAITDPRSVSIVGPSAKLDELFNYASEQGIQIQKMDIRGKVHNPENEGIAAELCRLCHETPSLELPAASELQVPVRSNKTGERTLQGSLTDEVVTTILASKCNWYTVLSGVAEDLKSSMRPAHSLLIFGLNDCVPMSPFHKRRLKTTKSEVHSLIPRIRKSSGLDEYPRSDAPFFQDSAIAVVGASCRLPGANNLEELWSLLANGSDQHKEISTDRFDLHGSFRASQSGTFASERRFYGNFLDDVKTFDNSFFGVNAREAANMDPQQRILLELSYEALEASGYLSKHSREAGDNVGCFIGASLVEYLDNTSAHSPTAYTPTGTIRAFLCGRLSYYYGWCGPAEVIDTACSSSLVAINRACKAIQAGECNMALTGGINIITGINNYLDLGKAGFLSPTGQCKPFDQSGDGYCRSDGAGLVVLKKLTQAIADGDQILGVIPGIATNQGGLSASITVPHSAAQQKLYRSVIKQSGLQPEQVTFVEAHGTGTQAGDPLEMESVRSIFGRPSRKDTLYIGSIKGNIGHCETAAGVAGLLKVLAMIWHGQVPPMVNHQILNHKIPALEPDNLGINQNLRRWDAPFRAALVNSYGAAGSNCALLCCEMPQQATQTSKTLLTQNDEIELPVLLSAATQESLLDYTRVLGTYLRQDSAHLKIGDITYSLNERRKRHKHYFTTTTRSTKDLAEKLLSFDLATCQEYPQAANPVVLCFSGQNNDRVGLDKTLYENYPAFRSYINSCDVEVKKLGFGSIIPAIFQTEPISDVVTLQTSLFAMQYSCAQCWIAGGLEIGAIIGHSLGELTALAVSGVLSLPDSIKLVASRAHLIETQWGSEKGAMMALNCTTDEFGDISSRLKSEGFNIEIACFNGLTSLVAVGTSATIDATEKLIRSAPALQKIRFQRLNTSHGFHSSLVDFILADLGPITGSLQWNEPRIPLEFCTKEHIKSIKEYSVSRHAREPVFFVNATQRLESRLGRCFWLEAGISTPIIAMARKASAQPERHDFCPMKIQGSQRSVDAVSNVVTSLWKAGVSATHWDFLPENTRQNKQIWLPPYQFAKTLHWRDNIDRTMEMQQTLLNTIPAGLVEEIIPPSPQLISRKESTAQVPGIFEFRVNTQCGRFRKIVGGHAVRQRPLCPASMYMECAAMAVQILIGDTGDSSLVFESLDFHSALGLDTVPEVVILLEETASKQSWKFTMQSSIKTGARPKVKTHVNGLITLNQNPTFNMFQRLVSGPIKRLDNNEQLENLMSKRAYALFSLVVDYNDFFQGIHSISLDDWEAIATIRIPVIQPNRDESTSWQICDTVTLDSFIQVVGLLMNSSDFVSRQEVMVMVGVERAIISPSCKMDDQDSWRVYAKFEFTESGQPVGDVFVSSHQGTLVAMLCGCKFQKLLISKLEKALDLANSSATTATAVPENVRNPPLRTPAMTAGGIITPATTASVSDSNDTALKELIAEYTGVDPSDISKDENLASLGLDSLASVELVGELLSKFGLNVSSDDLVTSTLNDLTQRLAGSQSLDIEAIGSGYHSSPESIKQESNGQQNNHSERYLWFLQLLADVSGATREDIELVDSLADLGVDSLSSVDFKQQLEEAFSLRMEDLSLDCTVGQLMKQLNIEDINLQPQSQSQAPDQIKAVGSKPSGNSNDNLELPNPFVVLKDCDIHFNDSAKKQGFLRHWSDVAPYQDELLLAYITEAFSTLGVDLSQIPQGASVPEIPQLAQKYDKLQRRLWEILQKNDIVFVDGAGEITRGKRQIDERSSSQLAEVFQRKFPGYEHETNLMSLTGPKLADCLRGKADPVSIMFGSPASLKIMENFYGQSPMMSTLTEHLVIFLTKLLAGRKGSRPVRILEVGAGTGGTTRRLVDALDSAGVASQYTFTDISPSLVAKAKNKFKAYPWVEFATFNLEKEVTDGFRNRFDVVVSANCVHATTDRGASCRRLKDVLTQDGFIVLSEVTRIINWYDICFGLLDGWWLAEGRTAYPLQPAEAWMSTFESAGFKSSSYSTGPTPEANSQQLLVSSKKQWDIPASTPQVLHQDGSYHLETIIYKEVDNVKIHADVFFPSKAPQKPMPIALMIHGGGHMTLSRKAIRPFQTQHLLANGFLPVSIDYRLCPEINLIDGPIADTHDAYQWIRTALPIIARRYGVEVDASKVVAVGWSSGGHLALSLGWTTKSSGIPPPAAVLSFYAPVDFESGELDATRLANIPGRTMSMEHIIAALPKTPITNYYSPTPDSTNLGWVRPGDPRSELVLSLFKEGTGLPLLLNGLSSPNTPSAEQIAAISPLAHLADGTYTTPTFIIHGTADQVVPVAAAERFVALAKEKGVRCGLAIVRGGEHIHDLKLRPGRGRWEEDVGVGYRFLREVVFDA